MRRLWGESTIGQLTPMKLATTRRIVTGGWPGVNMHMKGFRFKSCASHHLDGYGKSKRDHTNRKTENISGRLFFSSGQDTSGTEIEEQELHRVEEAN